MKLFFVVIFLVASLVGLSQSESNIDSVRVLCNGPIFTLCEKMPFLIAGSKALEDSLYIDLKSRDQFPESGSLSLTLTITNYGQIYFEKVRETNIDKSQEVINSILRFSSLWSPGIQNGRKVCCYRNIKFSFKRNRVIIHVPAGL
jgi:hypothetical protein